MLYITYILLCCCRIASQVVFCVPRCPPHPDRAQEHLLRYNSNKEGGGSIASSKSSSSNKLLFETVEEAAAAGTFFQQFKSDMKSYSIDEFNDKTSIVHFPN